MIIEIAIGVLLGYILIMLLPILIVSLPILIVGGLIVVLALLLITATLYEISWIPSEMFIFIFCGMAASINIYGGFIFYKVIVGTYKSAPKERREAVKFIIPIILIGILLLSSPIHFFIYSTFFSIFLISGYKKALS